MVLKSVENWFILFSENERIWREQEMNFNCELLRKIFVFILFCLYKSMRKCHQLMGVLWNQICIMMLSWWFLFIWGVLISYSPPKLRKLSTFFLFLTLNGILGIFVWMGKTLSKNLSKLKKFYLRKGELSPNSFPSPSFP